MTALAGSRGAPGWLVRMGQGMLALLVGAVLCAAPVTSLVALGWLTRRMAWRVGQRFDLIAETPGWILGARGTGRWESALGGLSANISNGLRSLTALLAWSLPFSALWLGAWWAGWENSFNKGYEQAFAGPMVFVAGLLIAAVLLPVIPFMLAHMAAEGRLAAAFQLRRIRGVMAQAGWRVAALAVLTFVAGLPFIGMHGFATLAPGAFPQVAEMTANQMVTLRGWLDFGTAAYAFAALWVLRGMAANIYATAAPRAAGLRPGLWDGAQAAEVAQPARARSRALTTLWVGMAMAAGAGIGAQMVVAQFINHAWWRWVFHPFFALPWAG
ncbi:MAG: hypothetical protein RLZZ437_340 [Pseudomonadota bacterium]